MEVNRIYCDINNIFASNILRTFFFKLLCSELQVNTLGR